MGAVPRTEIARDPQPPVLGEACSTPAQSGRFALTLAGDAANWNSGRDGRHHKPPYNSPDPFRYRMLTYVQLSHRSQSLVSL